MSALREARVLEGAASHDHWRTLDGHIDMDGEGGPFPHEVVRELITFAIPRATRSTVSTRQTVRRMPAGMHRLRSTLLAGLRRRPHSEATRTEIER